MFNAVLSIVSRFTTKEVVEVAAPVVEPRPENFGVRLAVLCTDLHQAMADNRWKDVEVLRKQIDALLGK
ncbi:hypothetical protein WELLINGTON_127 [Erwinia phage Wellington]|uniref:Uncharacterized protein n=1 Tax=Erwinia phage Wellington TaxID=2267653 RepID=A0A345BLD6_9CAUD|nr:hypothetical protein HOT70_gp174 [Erwinia phage Wellington]AXF51257.1 hypothetical protein WELLINGTON_127 [Erwinia phage Wellington]